MHYARRRDGNEREIIDALQAVGALVWQLDWTMDLLVWFRGHWYVIEAKMKDGTFKPSQKTMLKELPEGAVCVAREPDHVEQALRHIGAIGEHRA